MKRKLRFLAGACLFTATALFSGCSSDDDFLMDPVDFANPCCDKFGRYFNYHFR